MTETAAAAEAPGLARLSAVRMNPVAGSMRETSSPPLAPPSRVMVTWCCCCCWIWCCLSRISLAWLAFCNSSSCLALSRMALIFSSVWASVSSSSLPLPLLLPVLLLCLGLDSSLPTSDKDCCCSSLASSS